MQVAGIIYDEQRKLRQERFQKAVERATFLSDKEKENWALLGYVLGTHQLQDAEHLIIDEDLRRLGTREKLEKLKPKTEKNGR